MRSLIRDVFISPFRGDKSVYRPLGENFKEASANKDEQDIELLKTSPLMLSPTRNKSSLNDEMDHQTVFEPSYEDAEGGCDPGLDWQSNRHRIWRHKKRRRSTNTSIADCESGDSGLSRPQRRKFSMGKVAGAVSQIVRRKKPRLKDTDDEDSVFEGHGRKWSEDEDSLSIDGHSSRKKSDDEDSLFDGHSRQRSDDEDLLFVEHSREEDQIPGFLPSSNFLCPNLRNEIGKPRSTSEIRVDELQCSEGLEPSIWVSDQDVLLGKPDNSSLLNSLKNSSEAVSLDPSPAPSRSLRSRKTISCMLPYTPSDASGDEISDEDYDPSHTESETSVSPNRRNRRPAVSPQKRSCHPSSRVTTTTPSSISPSAVSPSIAGPIVTVFATHNTPKSVARQREGTYFFQPDLSLATIKQCGSHPFSSPVKDHAQPPMTTEACKPVSTESRKDPLLLRPPAISSLSSFSSAAQKNLTLCLVQKDTYQWSNRLHTCRHDLDDTIPLDASINSSCAVLSRLDGMYFSPSLRAVICGFHRVIVSIAEMKIHLHLHKVALRQTKLGPDEVIAHVTGVYHIPIDQSQVDIVQSVHSLRYGEPIPDLPAAKLCIPCDMCLGWYSTIKGLRRHYKEGKECACPSTVKAIAVERRVDLNLVIKEFVDAAKIRWTYATRMFYGTGTSSKYALAHTRNYSPNPAVAAYDSIENDCSDINAVHSQWPYYLDADGLNWIPYLQGLLSSGSTWSQLRQLVSLPSKAMIETWDEDSVGRQIELGLKVFASGVPARYLSDANYLVNNAGPEVANFFYQLTNSRFRDIGDKTFVRYRHIPFKLVALYARFRVIRESGKRHQLGKLTPNVSSREREIHHRIFEELKKGEKADTGILGKELHFLLIEVFTRDVSSRIPVASILQQVIVLSSMLPEYGFFQPANNITPLFAMVQRCAFSTFIHVAFLNGFDESYKATERPDLKYVEDDDCDEEDIASPAVVISPNSSGGDTTSFSFEAPTDEMRRILEKAKDMEDLSDHPTVHDVTPVSSNHILKILHDNRAYLTPKISDKSTEMNRIYSSWNILKKVAKNEKGKVEVEWGKDNSSLFLTWGSLRRRKVDLYDLRQGISTEATRLEACFLELTSGSNADEFCVSMINDRQDLTSMFHLSQNSRVFSSFIHSFKTKALGDIFNENGTLPPRPTQIRPAITNFLNRCFAFLRDHILPHMYHTCGVPPRAWQVGRLLYRDLAGHRRNLFVSSRSVVYLTNIPAKQRDLTQFPAFFALPPRLGLMLVFYLGVIRPVEIELRRFLSAQTVGHEYHIFVHQDLRQRTLSHFNETDTNNALKSSPALPYEARAQRQIFTGILEYCFPAFKLYTAAHLSPVAQQGQHTPQIMAQHYLGSDSAPQFAISQTLQAWFGLVPHNYELSLYQVEHNLLERERLKNSSFALLVALNGVRHCYKLTTLSQEAREGTIAKALRCWDFLDPETYTACGNEKAFGSDLLAQVTAAACFGNTQPTHAVLRALEASMLEQAQAPSVSDQSSMVIRLQLRPKIQQIIQHIQSHRPHAWNEFSQRVFEASFSHGRSVTVPAAGILEAMHAAASDVVSRLEDLEESEP